MALRGAPAWLLAIAVIACAGSQRHAAEERVARIGAERLAEAVDALRDTLPLPRALPEADWSPALRELKPQAIRITKQGVFVQLEKRFVEEAGVYVAFRGSSPPTGPGYDPSLTLLAPRVYWYEIKG